MVLVNTNVNNIARIYTTFFHFLFLIISPAISGNRINVIGVVSKKARNENIKNIITVH